MELVLFLQAKDRLQNFEIFDENLNMAYHFQILQHFSDRLANKIEIFNRKKAQC